MEAKASQTTLAGGPTPTIPSRWGPSFSSLNGLKSSFQARRGLGDTLVLNRMAAATHRHVSSESLCPRARRESPGVVCPNFREIRPLEEPWWNLEDWTYLPVATNAKSWIMYHTPNVKPGRSLYKT